MSEYVSDPLPENEVVESSPVEEEEPAPVEEEPAPVEEEPVEDLADKDDEEKEANYDAAEPAANVTDGDKEDEVNENKPVEDEAMLRCTHCDINQC